MDSSNFTLRANYWRPIWASVIGTTITTVLLIAAAVPEPYHQGLVWALLVFGGLLLVLVFAVTLSVIRLTPEGFSEPVYIMRSFTKWSDVSPFYVVNKRVLGMPFSGVGFDYVKPSPALERRKQLRGYHRIIDQSYGDPTEVARILNQWREQSNIDDAQHPAPEGHFAGKPASRP